MNTGAWQRGLYAIADTGLIAPEELMRQVSDALAGGAVIIQYRNKQGQSLTHVQNARALLALCRDHGVPLIINDDMGLAHEIAADGVHLGRDDMDTTQARALLGTTAIIGVSCYNTLDLALAAQAAGADYVAFGRFFPSHTKPAAVKAEPELLRRAKESIRIPLVAIGGITPDNGGTLIDAGADLLAVIHGVFGQHDVRAAARRYTQLFESDSGLFYTPGTPRQRIGGRNQH